MFPEGTRSRDRVLHEGFAGSALVAYRTGAPIIPIAIYGSENIPWPWVFVRPFMGPKVNVRVGKPFYPPAAQRITSEQAKVATDDIMLHIAELLPVEYQGAYRDRVAERLTSSTDAGSEMREAGRV
jgi:1-acyl-sn-glycerol-3-phosphate acyltransferase